MCVLDGNCQYLNTLYNYLEDSGNSAQSVLLFLGDKMQKFLTTHNIDAYRKTFDEVQQIYHNFLRNNPEIEGVWGEKSTDDNIWWMKGY